MKIPSLEKIKSHIRLLRDKLEWKINLTFTNQRIWCKNRLGQLYQPMSFIDYRYMRKGNPEVNVSLLIENLLQEGMNVVDVGANHGLFTIEAAYFVGKTGRVYAFEPTPELCVQIKKHLEVNNLKNVFLFEKAAGNFDGYTKLRVHHQLTGLNSLASQELIWNESELAADEVIDVPICRLDSIMLDEQIEHIDILKIDVEGFESLVLEGASRFLNNHRIKYIIIEIGECHEINSSLPVSVVLKIMAQFQYSIHYITPDGKIGNEVKDKQAYSGNGGNFVCVHS